jgi:ribosomal protein S6--L-glutamate ligase
VEARGGRPAVNPVMAALLDHLAGVGRPVRVRVPELDPLGEDRGPRPDLVLLKTVTTLALSVAVADEAGGSMFLNPAVATSATNDKAAVLARLAAAMLPVPVTYLIDPGNPGDPEDPGDPGKRGAGDLVVAGAAETPGGWVSKPVFGWHGTGIRFHESLSDALAPEATAPPGDGWLVDDGTRLVQRQIGSGEPDLKVYVAGEQIFAAAKAFSPVSFASDQMHPVELEPAVRDMVRATGETLGLRLFGVDLRFDAGSAVIIDVNPFPGFRGFPGAVSALLAEIDRAFLGVR